MTMRLISLILFSSLLCACNSVSTKSQGESLVNSIDEYVAALRWGRFDSAAQYHMNQDKSALEVDTSQLEYIRVTGHKVKKKSINDTVDEAQVEIELQYYHNEYGTLKKLLTKQTWWYSEEAKKWFLSNDFPKF